MYFWMFLVIFNFSFFRVSFIRYLLILEMLALGTLLLSSFMVGEMNLTLSLIFIFVVLSVGEATIGLSLLVRLSRIVSSESYMGIKV